MNERRRAPRIALSLPIELKHSGWDRHLAADISPRGLSVRLATPFLPGQLVQIRITLPGGQGTLELLGKMVRQDSPSEALTVGRLPTAGIEFFCPTTPIRNRWMDFVREAGRRCDLLPGSNGFSLMQNLESDPPATPVAA